MLKTMKLPALAVLFSLLIVNNSQAATLTDIASSKNRTAIEYLHQNKVISGYPDGTFKASNTINRAELLKILVGAKGINPTLAEYKNCFPDVKEEWFAPFVCYAKAQGWVEGFKSGPFIGLFRPEQFVNKVEAMKMLVNSQGYPVPEAFTETPKLFDDVETGAWYYPFLFIAYNKGLLEQESGNYGVGAFITRGEISENIYRAMFIRTYDFESFSDFWDQNYEYIATVKEVIDGDTIEIWMLGDQVEKIRLIGIDAPEMSENQCYSQEAKQELERLLVNTTIIMKADPSQENKDKYDRLLRYVFLPKNMDINVNKWMVEKGFAFEYTYDKPYQYQQDFQNAETTAKASKAGFWAKNTCNGQVTQGTDSGDNSNDTHTAGYKFYVSSKAKTKYYCETDSAWENLSPSNLLMYESEAELKTDFPNLVLNQPC